MGRNGVALLRRGGLKDPEGGTDTDSDEQDKETFEETEQVMRLRHEVRLMQLRAEPKATVNGEQTREDLVEEVIVRMTTEREVQGGTKIRAVKMGPETCEKNRERSGQATQAGSG